MRQACASDVVSHNSRVDARLSFLDVLLTAIRIMLRQVPLFSGLTDEQLQLVASYTITRRFSKKTIIINEADTSDCLYVVQSGKVKIFLNDESGKEVVLNTLGPGEYFGELALLDGEERSASVVTMEPSSFTVIFKETFERLISEHPEIALGLMKDLSQRVRHLPSK